MSYFGFEKGSTCKLESGQLKLVSFALFSWMTAFVDTALTLFRFDIRTGRRRVPDQNASLEHWLKQVQSVKRKKRHMFVN